MTTTSAHDLLVGLIGREIQTMTGRPNKILKLDRDRVLVATSRSPAGQWVLVAEVQDALEQLLRAGELEISVANVGYRSAFIGAVLSTLDGVAVYTRPRRIRLAARHPGRNPDA